MNKEEAIEKVKEHGEFYSNSFGGTANMVPVGPIINIISQIDEPQKVVVPKFVGDWIEECKASRRSLRDSMKGLTIHPYVNVWLLRSGREMYTYPNQETFARAWLDGYEIEQEKLYTVEIPNPNKIGSERNVLMKNGFNQIVMARVYGYGDNWRNNEGYPLTEAEIKKDFDFLWQFAEEADL